VVLHYGDAIFVGEEIPFSRSSSSNRDLDFESGRGVSNAETPAVVLQDIAMKCRTKVRKEIYSERQVKSGSYMHIESHLSSFFSPLFNGTGRWSSGQFWLLALNCNSPLRYF
jgi:hypothetical protein